MSPPPATTPAPTPPVLTLRAVRRLLEGVIPPAMCSVSEDGTPHVNYLSHAEYVDDEHVALTFQFFNRSRANVLATGRVALSIEDPTCGGGVMLRLHYLRTDTEGPIFERLRAKLAGIAAHTGMEKVFHLRGADVYRVEGLELMDIRYGLPSLASRCDLAGGVRRLGQTLAEAADMAALLRTFLAGSRPNCASTTRSSGCSTSSARGSTASAASVTPTPAPALKCHWPMRAWPAWRCARACRSASATWRRSTTTR